MSTAQKIIKYLALAFALFLIFTIVSWIIYGVSVFANLFNDNDDVKNENLTMLNINEGISALDIDAIAVNIKFKEGTILKAETNNKYIKVRQDSKRLTITEKKNGLFFQSDSKDLIIYVPKNYIFDEVSIDSGAGTINIDSLTTNNLYLDLGAGKINVNNLTVTNSTEIDGGAGEININANRLNDLDLDMGVGKFTLTSQITGNSKVDAGVGKMNLNLIGSKQEYAIKIEKGIGQISIDNKEVNNGNYGNGSNYIDIDGGVGSIDIKFQNK